MSAKCEWRDKQGGPETCKLMAEANGIYCPRHRFLHDAAEQARKDKEANKVEAKRHGVDGNKLPATRRQMLEKGYEYWGQGNCTGCNALIEWWRTPNLRMAPFNPMPLEASFSKSHFATCPKRAEFRKAS